MARREELTDEQWAIIAPLIPEPPRREDGRGRPWKDSREVMNGILWVLRSGARWEDLPERFPPYQTCHRRFQQWVREGVLRSVLEALAEDLRARGELDLSECFIDGMFVVAKKGARSRKNQAGQRYEAHGGGRRRWFSSRRSPERLLRRMKSPLSQTLSSKASSRSSRSD
jgi:transposase